MFPALEEFIGYWKRGFQYSVNRGFQYSGVTIRARVTCLFKLNHYDLDGSM